MNIIKIFFSTSHLYLQHWKVGMQYLASGKVLEIGLMQIRYALNYQIQYSSNLYRTHELLVFLRHPHPKGSLTLAYSRSSSKWTVECNVTKPLLGRHHDRHSLCLSYIRGGQCTCGTSHV